MIKESKQPCGDEMAILLESDIREEIVRVYFSYWNHKACSWGFSMSADNPFYDLECTGEEGLNWIIPDHSAYFMTTPAKCLKAMQSAALFKIFQDQEWDGEPTLKQIVDSQRIGKEKFDSLPHVVITDFEAQITQDKFFAALPTVAFPQSKKVFRTIE